MAQEISLLKLSSTMARHATQAHGATADNLARVDVPGAKRRELIAFQDALKASSGGREVAPELTREPIKLDAEMLSMAEARGRHEAAMSVWKSTLGMLRLAIRGPQ
ncbi:hypothetical protein HK107_03405 [Parvularcula sp. ZS-1/3]|uniref:Uncharacterized protein n=1 Tax=Parvularcula mediterranea TaxID=2732508 RepID=A0A7Y3RJT6_9PROT|nr:hypothetical protein [Parvularcula mediterranea]NNU15373.1 hypothetical protein [Parvularcula mediterranea]